MSQQEHDNDAARNETPVTAKDDRRDFLRQSLGVAPLMLTLGSKSFGSTSMQGTLWASGGDQWNSSDDWWSFKKDKWQWTKGTDNKFKKKKSPPKYSKKETPAEKDWDWGKSTDDWKKDVEADSKPKSIDWDEKKSKDAKKKYDWSENKNYGSGGSKSDKD